VLQHGLFIPQAPAPEKLQLTLARLTALLGEGNVGSPELLDTHRPDAFVMRAFSAEAPASPTQPSIIRFAFRYYRPPIAAQVRVKAERPVSVNTQPILTAAGPWRASGDWWTTAPWDREEWDVELSNGGLYRVYQASQRWFLEGMYD
jgi:protein ImuB